MKTLIAFAILTILSGTSFGDGSVQEWGDSGDDPGTPGCVGIYGTTDCTGDPIYRGDLCSADHASLLEWTTSTTCTANPTNAPNKTYNCADWCIAEDYGGGYCEETTGVCAAGSETVASAQCSCY